MGLIARTGHRGRTPVLVTGLLAVLGAWVAVFIAFNAVSPDPDPPPLVSSPGGWAFTALGTLVLLARAARPGDRLPWALMGAAFALTALGDGLILWSPQAPGSPGPLDAAYVTAKLLLLAGLVALLRRCWRGGRPALWLDAVTTGLAVAAAASWLIVGPVLATIGPGQPVATALQLVYPLVDGATIVLAAVGGGMQRWRVGRTWALVSLGVIVLVAANAAYGRAIAEGTWSPGSLLNAGWNLSVLLIAWAAWSGRLPTVKVAQNHDLRDSLLPLLFAFGAVAMLVAAPWIGLDPVPVALAGAALLAALARLVVTSREHAELLRVSRREALTDPLTGLGNRRRLMRDLDAALRSADPARPVALVLFDLDGFKALNDRLGHPAGDALLIALGGELAADVGLDRVYRLGGDEFAALVDPGSGTLEEAVAEAAATMRRAGATAGVGSSHGSLILQVEASDTTAALDLADRRLYADKLARKAAVAAHVRPEGLPVLLP